MKQFVLSALLFVFAGYALYEHFLLENLQFKAVSGTTSSGSAQQQQAQWETEKTALNDQIAQLTKKVSIAEANLAQEKAQHPVEVAPTTPVAPAPVVPEVKAAPPVGPSADQLAARQAEVGKSYYVMVLRDGTVLRRVTVAKVDFESVSFTGDTGTVVIKAEKLPSDMGLRLGLTKEIVDAARAEAKKAAAETAGDSGANGLPDGATYFGVPAPAKAPGNTTVSSTVQTKIGELKAQAKALRDDAATATSQDEMQKKLQQATKIDQLIKDLESVNSN